MTHPPSRASLSRFVRFEPFTERTSPGSGGALKIEQGALYPALFRLVRKGSLQAKWGVSDNNQRAKFYSLTPAGRKRLREELEGWNRLVAAMGTVLEAGPEQI